MACLRDAREFTRHMTQYQCPRCHRAWWGKKRKGAECYDCNIWVTPLPFSQQVGIGWFHCDACDREFAGFARGDVESKCHQCQQWLLPSCIIRGDKAHGEKTSQYKHYCEKCHGKPPCPVVEAARRVGAPQLEDESLHEPPHCAAAARVVTAATLTKICTSVAPARVDPRAALWCTTAVATEPATYATLPRSSRITQAVFSQSAYRGCDDGGPKSVTGCTNEGEPHCGNSFGCSHQDACSQQRGTRTAASAFDSTAAQANAT